MSNDLTHITVILDRSGSMSSVVNDVIGGFNTFLAEQQQASGQATLTLVQFDSQNPYECIADRQPIDAIAPLDRGTYVPRGMTPLFDAVGQGITELATALTALDKPARPAQVIFVIVTDGEENASRRFTYAGVRLLIEQHGDWQFLYLSSSLRAMDDARNIGIAPDQSVAMPQSGQGMRDAWRTSSTVSSGYRDGTRSRAHIYEDERLRHDDPNRDAFLARAWPRPRLSGQRVLVVGIGGGSDAIMAYALAAHLQHTAGASGIYGSTTRGHDLPATEAMLSASGGVACAPYLWSLQGQPVALTSGQGAVPGSVTIDNSLPRGNDGSPLLCVLPASTDSDGLQALTASIRQLGVDRIFAVDAGGHVFRQRAGRDVRMLGLLTDVGCPVTLAVFGPGCGGSAELSTLIEYVRERDRARRYEGCMRINPLVPLIAPLAAGLAPDRTPNMMLDAAHRPDSMPVRVRRGANPTIPAGWLSHILFFTER